MEEKTAVKKSGKNYQLKVDTGKVTYTIVDEFDEKLGEVRFNPADFGLWPRAEAFVQNMNAIEEPAEGEVTAQWFQDTADYICGQFDALFAGKVSDGLFGITFPFSVLENGDFYFEECAYRMIGLIEELLGKRMDTKLRKLQKGGEPRRSKGRR